jgi:hypothetical protein
MFNNSSLSALSLSVLLMATPAANVLELNAEEASIPGIELWSQPSGIRKCIEGTSFEDLLSAFEKDSFVYLYSNNKKAIVVTSDGMTHHYTNRNTWGISYSVLTMRDGTLPPVAEINEKIGSGNDLKVKFYKYADSNEYRFYVLSEEYQDLVLEILKKDENVLSIENRREITEDEFRFDFLYVKTDLPYDEFKKEYSAFGLKTLEEWGGALPEEKKAQGYTLGFYFERYNLNEEFYDSWIKLENSGIDYEIVPLIAHSSGVVTSELVEKVYVSESIKNSIPGDVNFDGIIDVTDLTELSLALIGDKELTSEQKNVADVDGDGSVTLADLARFQQFLSKKVDSFR